MEKTKVYVEVRGGLVTDMYSTDPNIEVEMWDYDNLEEEGSDEELNTDNLHHIY